MIGEIKGITFISILYLIFGFIGSFIINKLEKDIFKDNALKGIIDDNNTQFRKNNIPIAF